MEVGDLCCQMRDNPIEIFSPSDIAGVGIRNVVVPSHVEKDGYRYEVVGIGRCAFSNCRDIVTLHLPETLTYIREKAFLGCRNLVSVVMSGPTEIIGDSAFSGCVNLRDVTMGELLNSIGKYSFWRCGEIETVLFPASLRNIGRCAFAGCDKLKDIYCYAAVPPRCDEWSFGFTDEIFNRTILHVPMGKCEEYALEPLWHKFSNIIELDEVVPIAGEEKSEDVLELKSLISDENGKEGKVYTVMIGDKKVKITIDR